VRALSHISEQSGARIVAGTGEYVLGSHSPGLAERPEEALVDELIGEILVGIGGTGIRAGVIGEVGADQHPMASAERVVLRASAAACRATGAAIVAHPAPGPESAFEVAEVLLAAGADPSKVCIAHLDDRFRGELPRFRRLAAMGVRFGFDTFGREAYYRPRDRQHPSDTERIAALVGLADAGLIDAVVLSHDLCMKIDLGAYGGTGYDHLLIDIVPRLRAVGLDDPTMDALVGGTARRMLAIPGSAPA
jgi:phosphotriesterase-related protein